MMPGQNLKNGTCSGKRREKAQTTSKRGGKSLLLKGEKELRGKVSKTVKRNLKGRLGGGPNCPTGRGIGW